MIANTILSALEVTEITVEAAEKKIDAMQKLYKQTDKLVPGRTYSLIGQAWKEVTAIVNPGFVVEDEEVLLLRYILKIAI